MRFFCYINFLFYLVLLLFSSAHSQSPTPPSFGTFQQINPYTKQPAASPSPQQEQQNQIQQQNREIILRSGGTPPPTQNEIKSTNPAIDYRQNQKYRQQVLYNQLRETEIENSGKHGYKGMFPLINTSNPQYKSYIEGFETAFSEITSMLNGSQPIDFRKAVYLTENTILRNQVSYEDYGKAIDNLKNLIRQQAQKEKLNIENSTAIHYLIQKLYQQPLTDKQNGKTQSPFQYDFNDFMGELDYRQVFVVKLLKSGNGQCRSMPLLYYILATELGAETYLSFSPNHSYIKFRDEGGNFYNFETTNGRLASDAWITESGFVKSEAIKNKIYTDTVNTKQILAHLITDLVIIHKHTMPGYNNEFMNKCIDTSLSYFPNSIAAHMLKAELTAVALDNLAYKYNYPPINALGKYPELEKQLAKTTFLFDKVEDLGHSDMPEQSYIQWLKQLEREKEKAESRKIQQLLIHQLQK